MSEFSAEPKIKRTTIEAVVIKADGTRHDLGKVADSKWNSWSFNKFRANGRIQRFNRVAS